MPNDKKRTYIRDILHFFKLELTPEDNAKLEKDESINLSNYLTPYVLPLIPELYRKKVEEEALIPFETLMKLCFAGHVSMEVWDTIWALLPETQQIFYATIDHYQGYPLRIAAENNNINALRKLDSIYSSLIEKHPDRKYRMHWSLRSALEHGTVKGGMKILLEMIERYSVADPTSLNQSIFNKKLAYHDTGITISEGTTPVLTVLSAIARSYIENVKTDEFTFLCTYLIQKNITMEEFKQFQEFIVPTLNTEPKFEYMQQGFETMKHTLKHTEQVLHDKKEQQKKQKDHIVTLLKQFNTSLDARDAAKLEKDESIVMSTYLNTYLPPKIPKTYTEDTAGQFQTLIQLCLQGNLSLEYWDKIWAIIPFSDHIEYATRSYDMGGIVPFTTMAYAARHGNLEALKKLDVIYSTALNLDNKTTIGAMLRAAMNQNKRSTIHGLIRGALQAYHSPLKPQDDIIFKEEDIPCLEFLLDMMVRYSFSKDDHDKNLMNRHLDYKIDAMGRAVNGTTPLSTVYAEIAEYYLLNTNLLAFTLICSHLSKQPLSDNDMKQFYEHMSDFMNKEIPQNESNALFHESVASILLDLTKQKRPNQPTDTNQSIENITKRLLKITQDYKLNLSTHPDADNKREHAILQSLLDVLTKGHAENASAEDHKKTIEAYYSILNTQQEDEVLNNYKILQCNQEQATLRFIAKLAAITVIILTGIIPGLIAIAVVRAITGNASMSFFNTPSENFKQEKELIEEEHTEDYKNLNTKM